MRKKSMRIKEFMNQGRETVSKKELAVMDKGTTAGMAFGLSMLPLAFSPLTKVKQVFASDSVPVIQDVPAMATRDMTSEIMTAFGPLIDLVQSLAYPVAMVVALGGAIMVMISRDEKGYSMMMSAGLGIILVNMTPMVLNILVDAMKTVV